MARSTVKANAAPFTFRLLTSQNHCTSAGSVFRKRRTLKMDRIEPAAPPNSDSKMLSVSSWLRTRQRLAPRAARIAISCCRPEARANCRVAMFVQAIEQDKTNHSHQEK